MKEAGHTEMHMVDKEVFPSCPWKTLSQDTFSIV